MENNEYLHIRKNILGSLSGVQKDSSDTYNKMQEGLSNGLSTAATTYIAIILAFINNVADSFDECSWIIIVSVFSFSASLVPWGLEKIIASVVCSRRISTSQKLSDVANEISDEGGLVAVDKVAAKLLCGDKTSLIPIIVQISLFFIGILFATIAIAIVLLNN